MPIAISTSVRQHATTRAIPNVQPQRFRRTRDDVVGVVWTVRILPMEAGGSSRNLADDEPVIILHHQDGFPIDKLERFLDTSDEAAVSEYLADWEEAGGTFSLSDGAAAKAYDAIAASQAASRDNANAAVAARAGTVPPRRRSLAAQARQVFRGGGSRQPQSQEHSEEHEEAEA